MAEELGPREFFDPPERMFFVPAPNLPEPLKGGAFLEITQGGEKRRYALNVASLLQLSRGVSAVLLVNFGSSLRHQQQQNAEIEAFTKALDDDDAIDHFKSGEEGIKDD